MGNSTPHVRFAEIERETNHTRVSVAVDLEGGNPPGISTGIGFFDHMLEQLAFHGGIAFGIQCDGDKNVDDHHTVEDVGIVLGQALAKAIETGGGRIQRYGSNHTAMDDALVLCAIDISGRPYLNFEVPFKREKLGELSTECVEEFFRALSLHAGMTLHFHKIDGTNDHHLCEACFKGFARALKEAIVVIDRASSPTSTKG